MEGAAIEIVVYVLEIAYEIHLPADAAVFLFVVGRAVVEVFPIGAPPREAIHVAGVLGKWYHFVVLDVVEDKVAVGVLHLHLLQVACVECLAGGVGAVGNQFLCGVPTGVDACADGVVGLQIDLLRLPVVGDYRASQALTDMELHAVRVVLLEGVAVDALPILFGGVAHRAIDNLLVVILQTALVDGQLLVVHVAWGDQAVGDVRVDAVLGDVEMEGFHAKPLVVTLGVDGDLDILAGSCQFLPLLLAGAYIRSRIAVFLIAAPELRDEFFPLILDGEPQGSNVQGNRHVGVFRIDAHGLWAVGRVGRGAHRAAYRQKHQPYTYIIR